MANPFGFRIFWGEFRTDGTSCRPYFCIRTRFRFLAVCSGQNSNFFRRKSRRRNLKQCGRSFAETIFWGKDSAKLRLIPFSEFGCRKRRRRGLGRNPPLAPLFVLAKFGRASIKEVYHRYSKFEYPCCEYRLMVYYG